MKISLDFHKHTLKTYYNVCKLYYKNDTFLDDVYDQAMMDEDRENKNPIVATIDFEDNLYAAIIVSTAEHLELSGLADEYDEETWNKCFKDN